MSTSVISQEGMQKALSWAWDKSQVQELRKNWPNPI